MRPIEKLNLLARAAADRANEGDVKGALALIRQVASGTDALLNIDLSAQTAAIEELQEHHAALTEFYDN